MSEADIKDIRKMIEMAYHYAWGPKGDADLRDDWQDAFKGMIRQFPEIGHPLWNGETFTWTVE